MLTKIGRFFIRISAFLRKEIVNILRQPQLILSLVLGPFLILFIFGIGFREAAPKLRTLFVVDEQNALLPYIEEYATSLGPQLVFSGIMANEDRALDRLRGGSVDAVVVVPANAIDQIRGGESAVFTVYHNEIMPTEAGYVEFTMNIYVDVLNRRVLTRLIENEQQEIDRIRTNLQAAQQRADQLHAALISEDMADAQASLVELDETLETISPTLQTMAQTETTTMTQNLALLGFEGWYSGTLSTLQDVDQSVDRLRSSGLNDTPENAQITERVSRDLQEMDTILGSLQRLEAVVVTNPFRSETRSVTPVTPEMIDYYTPAVVALLLQHLCVTFAALSIVQEELIGAMEVFKVAPISAFEMLIGKYLSYLIFNSIIAAILTGLVIYILDVPMVGRWADYALALLGVMFASLGLGFLVSLLANSTSQAVQISMLLLLGSVFFTGFMQGLDALKVWTRPLSWSLPATYGITMLKDIMLRGTALSLYPVVSAGLVTMGVGLFLVDWFLLGRHMSRG